MNHYRLIDDNGMFVEDVLLESIPTTEDEDGTNTTDPHYIQTPCPDGFYWPKWDGEQWVEGGVAPAPAPPAIDPLTETRLAMAELAQVVEDNNTATQLAIAELAGVLLGG